MPQVEKVVPNLDSSDARYRPVPSETDTPETLSDVACDLVVSRCCVSAFISVKGAELSIMAGTGSLQVTIVPSMAIKRLGSRALSIRGASEPPEVELRFTDSLLTEQVARALHDALCLVVQSLFATLLVRRPNISQRGGMDKRRFRRYGLPLACAHVLYMPQPLPGEEPIYELVYMVLIMSDLGPDTEEFPWHSLRIYPDERCRELLYTTAVGGISRLRLYPGGLTIEIRERTLHRLTFASTQELEVWGKLLRDVASVNPGDSDECIDFAPPLREKGRLVEEVGILAEKGLGALHAGIAQPLLERAPPRSPWNSETGEFGVWGSAHSSDTDDIPEAAEAAAGPRPAMETE